jgi:hypothetical protein
MASGVLILNLAPGNEIDSYRGSILRAACGAAKVAEYSSAIRFSNRIGYDAIL